MHLPRRLWPALALAAMLLLAQALALHHRVEHGSTLGSRSGPALGWADHEAGTADCRLIDQHGLGDGLCAAWGVPAATEALPHWAAPPPAPAVARAAPAAYRARAPPA